MIQTKLRKSALITGVTGQDGSYLARLLLDEGYRVYGLRRRVSTFRSSHRLDDILENPNFTFIYGDMTDTASIIQAIERSSPGEIYNLAAQSHVSVSFENPEYTAQVDALGTLRILEAIRLLKLEKEVRIYQASTSELYGTNDNSPQSETTPFQPASPYGVAKLYSFWLTKIYREAYSMYISNGILFNHESPRRGENFVSRKIIDAFKMREKIPNIKLKLGNLDAIRDWGHAEDYVRAMYLMMQQPEPNDLVIATGVAYTVRQFVERVASKFSLNLVWEGSGSNEKGYVDGELFVEIDEKYIRPLEVPRLQGDSSKARTLLNWKPKHDLESLIDDMISG